MSDDLVKRLRDLASLEARAMPPAWRGQYELYSGAADRIEELAKACDEWAEVSQSNYQRAKVAEANLAKVVYAGNKLAHSIEGNYYFPSIVKEWRTTLAELSSAMKGQDDE